MRLLPVEPHNMKLVPVVNNKTVMSAMAGPGNAVKVGRTGPCSSWKRAWAAP